jgi:RNA polymerase sigma-70 factor (ECF subfamily)
VAASKPPISIASAGPPPGLVKPGLAGPSRVGLPETTLVRFRDGDVDALSEVYDRYARPVWSVAMTVTHADHLAQEAVQETFIRAWSSASTYDPERDLGPWLLTIARYTALDLLRRELRPTRGGHEAEQDAVVEPPDLDRAWLSWAVQEALRQLGDHEREIIRLSFYEDLTHVQISERLGLPLGTVKSRSHRAHRRLAELLAHVRDAPEVAGGGNPAGAGGRTHVKGERMQGRDDG